MSLPDEIRNVLPADTAMAWELLAPVIPAPAYLGGGTAIAVHLGHRVSHDLDFFYHRNAIDLDRLARTIDTLTDMILRFRRSRLNSATCSTRSRPIRSSP